MDSLRGQPNPESRVRAEHIDQSKYKSPMARDVFADLLFHIELYQGIKAEKVNFIIL